MARGPDPDTVEAAREMVEGYYGLRYSRTISKECELPLEDASKALELGLTAILPAVRNRYGGDLLAHLTSAVARALFSGMPVPDSPMIRYCRESVCVDRFVKRVGERDEPFIEDCLKAELFHFFAGPDPGPYRAAMAMPGA